MLKSRKTIKMSNLSLINEVILLARGKFSRFSFDFTIFVEPLAYALEQVAHIWLILCCAHNYTRTAAQTLIDLNSLCLFVH